MKVRQEVYDEYWKLAAERQEIFFKKLKKERPPYTEDPILQSYKFCNTYRASDRVSQYLIKDVIYKYSDITSQDHLFRIFLFRLLNKSETWERLEKYLNKIELKNYDFNLYSETLEKIKLENQTIYGNAFILCANDAFGMKLKHKNHLKLLESIFFTDFFKTILDSKSLKELFYNLKQLPLIGNFMAYQIAIDLNYSEVFNFSENDFTIAGPGAERGIKKCFESTDGKSWEYIIQFMVENQDKEFERLGIKFKNLFGRKLHAIDCQGLFCEIDKYSRVKFPQLKSTRSRIKTKYSATSSKIKYFYPPKWQINDKINQL